MSIINLYSVPIFCTQLEDDEKITSQEAEIIKSIELKRQPGNNGNFISEETHILDTYRLDRIKSICDKYIHHYTENIVGVEEKFKMFRSWLTMNVKGTKHDAHGHRNTMLSCILYMDEDLSDNTLSPINFGQKGFDQIFQNFQFQFTVKERNQYNNNILSIYPKTNTLIVFPGWINHEVPLVTNELKRYCIGTNYFMIGESASSYHKINIDVS
jgi:uncharacterized protein (TIGR02466 family)